MSKGNGESNAPEQTVLQLPAQVPLPGKIVVGLKEYIMNNPCPNCNVSVAVELLGGMELALRDAAMDEASSNGASKRVEDSILADAKKKAAAAKEAGR